MRDLFLAFLAPNDDGAWLRLIDRLERSIHPVDRAATHSWLKGSRRVEVVFDEDRQDARFPLIPSQHLATAAALDTRPWRNVDARCSEGPIPVQCRSCSCGTCWIGVLAGADRLSPMDDCERGKLRECGIVVEGSHPVMRLSCMAQAFGPTTIVIPPWNGLVGRVLKAAS